MPESNNALRVHRKSELYPRPLCVAGPLVMPYYRNSAKYQDLFLSEPGSPSSSIHKLNLQHVTFSYISHLLFVISCIPVSINAVTEYFGTINICSLFFIMAEILLNVPAEGPWN